MISPDHQGSFEAYCRRKEAEACAAPLAGFRTIFDRVSGQGLRPIGNGWTRDVFDGDFYVREPVHPGLPAVSLVFVRSREGNTVADDPSTLGGGETDKHLVYEGLSRVAADAVLAGAATARGEETVFSVWHPQLVALRRASGTPRHPAQVVVTASADLPFDRGLMFTTPELRVLICAPSGVTGTLRGQLRDRPWIEVIDGGEPLSMATVMRSLYNRGLRVISAVGGRRTATALMREALVTDLYVTTSAITAGEPNSPFYIGDPPRLYPLIEKEGRGAETGVRFEHLAIHNQPSNVSLEKGESNATTDASQPGRDRGDHKYVGCDSVRRNGATDGSVRRPDCPSASDPSESDCRFTRLRANGAVLRNRQAGRSRDRG